MIIWFAFAGFFEIMCVIVFVSFTPAAGIARVKLPNHLPTNLSLASTGASSFLQDTNTIESKAIDKKRVVFFMLLLLIVKN
jgi:hypothetical protein